MERAQSISLSGAVWRFGDNIDTDIIIATQYLINDLDSMKSHAFEVIEPQFAAKVGAGDIIVAGNNFGCGSSREQAVDVIRALGVSAVIAKSFARIFYRNAINSGLPVIVYEQADLIPAGSEVSIDISQERIEVSHGTEKTVLAPFPEFIMEIINQARGDSN